MERMARHWRTRTGLVIGGHFIPQPPPQSRDADLLQDALINGELPLLERLLDAFNAHAGRFFVLLAVLATVLGAIFK
jgi:hypothetical protein